MKFLPYRCTLYSIFKKDSPIKCFVVLYLENFHVGFEKLDDLLGFHLLPSLSSVGS
jgi:hypothetical protein